MGLTDARAGALPDALSDALSRLRQGGVVAYPTETYYGLAVDALDEGALEALLRLKGRGAERTVSLIVSDAAMVDSLCADIPPRARALMAAHWPGALTLVLPARSGLPAALVADGCVALRQSSHPLAAALVRAWGRPITATSANRAGQPPARTAGEVRASFTGAPGADGPGILDGGETAGGPPSTLVRVRGQDLEILRPGAVVVDLTWNPERVPRLPR
jgi:L-threonylcarbamoyladenylate synthase